MTRCLRFALPFWLTLIISIVATAQETHSLRSPDEPRHFAAAPFQFVENIGQLRQDITMQGAAGDATVRFMRSGVDYIYAVERHSASGKPIPGVRNYLLHTEFIGSRADVVISGEQTATTRYNYYLGADPEEWYLDARGYRQVRYHNLYTGIDALYYGSGNRMKYDFVVSPGADHSKIVLRYDGASSLHLSDSGHLEITTPFGTVREAPPYSYQEINGQRVTVEASYRLLGGTSYGFTLGSHNPQYPVIIDPCLSVEYATYFGGGAYDVVTAMAVDSSGASYAIGFTRAPDFPIVPDTGSLAQQNYTFISKLSSNGTQLIYSTVIAPSYNGPYLITPANQQQFESLGEDIEVLPAGDAFVAMTTNVSGLPTTAGAYRRTKYPNNTNSPCIVQGQPNFDAYVVRLNSTGKLAWGTYLGGSSNEYVSDIALDGTGNVHITGLSYSPVCSDGSKTVSDSIDFPVSIPEGIFNSTDSLKGFETFVAKLSATGQSLNFSALYGGTGDELPGRIAVTADGRIIIVGATNSSDLVTTTNAYQRSVTRSSQNIYDLYIARINPASAQLEYSSYFADNGAGRRGVGIGALSMRTNPNAPLSGFERNDRQMGLLLDRFDGVIIFGGSTRSTSLPGASGGVSPSLHNPNDTGQNSTDAYMVRMNINTNQVLGATYLGGNGFDGFGGMTFDSFGDVAVAIVTTSPDLPRTPIAIQPNRAGVEDAAILVVSSDGRSLRYGSYLGGGPGSYQVEQRVYGITAGNDGALYMFGGTGSPDFPVTARAIQKENDYFSGFIVKFAAPGSPQIGTGARVEFDLSLCDSVEFVKHTIFNAGQLPAKIDAITFQRGQNFYVVNPPVFPYTLGACEELPITIAFRPTDIACNRHVYDTLIVSSSNAVNKQVQVPVMGTKVCLSFSLQNATIVDSNHRLGSQPNYRFPFTVQGDEPQYITVTPDPGSSEYFWPVPWLNNTHFTQGTSFIGIASFPPDTGYYCASFNVHIEPCNRDRKINICIYSRSGIYSGPEPVDLGLNSCREILYPFVIHNTGNDSLHLRVLYGGGSGGEDVLLDSALITKRVIAAGDSTTYIARIWPKGYGKRRLYIQFATDDLKHKEVAVIADYELDSVAVHLAANSLVGGFGETVTLPVQYQSILEGRLPTTEISFLTRFDPALLDLASVDTKGTLTDGWQIVEKELVRGKGTFVWLRKGETGAALGPVGTLANLNLTVLRGNAVEGPLGIELAGVSKGCITSFIDSGYSFQLSPECRDQDRLLYLNNQMLKASIPNPVRDAVSIPYRVPEAGHVTLSLFDISGREVLRLIDDTREAGEGEVQFRIGTLPAGRYFYRMQAGDYMSETLEMVIER